MVYVEMSKWLQIGGKGRKGCKDEMTGNGEISAR
jgi:hypothetical protein